MENQAELKRAEDITETDRKIARVKMRAIIEELSHDYPGRASVVRALVLGAIAGAHVLLLGPPGTGKSLLVRDWTRRILGATGFDWLMTRFTTPDEIFGPVSVTALKADTFRRVPTGKLPEAHVGFLDEVWKANSAILNALLTIVNERVWHNGGTPVRVPLVTLVGASNELPQEEGLGALYDRFTMRFVVGEMQAEDDFCRLLRGELGMRKDPAAVTLEEILHARADAAAMRLPQAVAGQLYQLRLKLSAKGITLSSRRWRAAVGVMQAAAWLDGAKEVGMEHAADLEAVLWETLDQRDDVRDMVAKVCAPELAKAREYHDAAMEKANTLPEITDATWVAKAAAANMALRTAMTQVKKLYDKPEISDATREAIRVLGKALKTRRKQISEALQGGADQEESF